MNEEQTKHDLITPALVAAGWDTMPYKLAFEQQVAPGRVGSMGAKKVPRRADYVLMCGAKRVAVVEAKADTQEASAGEAQAREYGAALGVRYAFATNGRKVRTYDLEKGTMSECGEMVFPTPVELMKEVAASEGALTELERACREKAFLAKTRYYQERAVEGIIRALGHGKKNALVTLATGTGKTFIAYQLVKKLVEVKWSRNEALGKRKPRVLFLADRNILASQAMESFSKGFEEGECYRLEAGAKKVPLDRTVYFTLYQTLLGKGEGEALGDGEAVKMKAFKKDFFDLVIVDECHRGGANDESAWRVVLDYFVEASHVGLTATPKCDKNGSTYEYFGKPVYEYSLKQGIEDGFLTPYRVKVCHSTISTYRYNWDDIVENEEVLDKDRTYLNDELEHKKISIPERDRHFVRELLEVMPLDEKAIIFCVTQAHALRIAWLIREEAGKRGKIGAHFCERVTAEDGEAGEMYLRQFRDNESTEPMILTTSQKLSTGVDACNVRSIVLLKDVQSMIEFKQIIGRGTRLYEGKAYFTIYDFTDATKKFYDPAWDGPVVCAKCGKNPCECKKPVPKVCPKCGQIPCVCEKSVHEECPVCGCWPCICEKPPLPGVKVTLANGRILIVYWDELILFDGKMMGAEAFLNKFVAAVKGLAKTSKALKARWADMTTREGLLETLARAGFDEEKLKEIQANVKRTDCDILDVMLDIAYDVAPVTRAIRAEAAKASAKRAGWLGREVAAADQATAKERAALSDVILKSYVKEGVWTLTAVAFRDLLVQKYGGVQDACRRLGWRAPDEANEFYERLQKGLYAVAE